MSKTSLQAYRAHLLKLSEQKDAYPFLTLAERYLHLAPADHQIRAGAISRLVRKGLTSVAVELAAGCPGEDASAEELRRAADGLARLPGEVLAPGSRRACFDHNLRSLRRVSREGADLACRLEEAWRLLEGDLTFHQAGDGNLLARATLNGRRQWVPAALDFVHHVEAVKEAEGWKGTLLPPFLIEGVGTGRLVAVAHAASRCTYLTHSAPFFVIETDLRALALALHLHDWSEALGDERFFLFAGPRAWDEWHELMAREETLAVPRELTRLPRWPDQPAPPGEAIFEQVAAHREALVEHHRAQIEQTDGPRSPGDWEHRFRTAGPHDPLRILAVTSRFTTVLQHSMRDLLAAFERAGMRTRLLIEEKDHHTLPAHAYLQATAEFRPDLLVVIDHHRHEYRDRMPRQVPWLCWIQDELEHLMRPDVGPRLGPLDFTMGFGLTQCVLQFGYPVERFMPCRMAVNPAKFGDPSEPPGGEFECDLLYVSHHSQPPEELHARWRSADSGPVVRFIDAFYEQHYTLFASERFNAGYDLGRLIEQTEAQQSLRIDPVMRSRLLGLYVRPLADRFLRHTTLSWAADWADAAGRRLHIYGNGWEQHPRFGRYARGPLAPGETFGRVVRGAAVSLHLGLNPALHQRVLETLAAGGFVMARYCPGDFHDPANDIFWEYLVGNGLDRPGRVATADFPDGYRRGRALLAERTNRIVTDELEITEELLLEQRTRRQDDPRYHFADLAFPGYAGLTFDSPAAFAERAGYFLEHRDDRARIAAAMRQSVCELFTYDALVGRIIPFITSRLPGPQRSRRRLEAALAG